MSVTTLSGGPCPLWGCGKPFLGGKFCFGGVVLPWLLAGMPKKGLSQPIEGKAHT